jgi:hypothetical protein
MSAEHARVRVVQRDAAVEKLAEIVTMRVGMIATYSAISRA